MKFGFEWSRTKREGEPGGSGPFFLGGEVEEVEEAGEEKYTFDPRDISCPPSSPTSMGGARDCLRGEDFLEGGRGRGMTLWLEANNGVRLRSLFGVTRPVTPMSPAPSNPWAAPRGLTGVPDFPVVEGPGPKTRCCFTGVTKFMGTSRLSGGGEAGRVGRAEVAVFCRFTRGTSLSVQTVGSSPVVGGEGNRNRFFAAARCASWDSGVVSPNGGILLGPALSGGEKGGRSSTDMDGSSSTPGRFLGVEVTACENDGGINA